MIIEDIVESVGEQLFSDEDLKVFAVIDGASVKGLLDKLYDLTPNFCCLFKGELTPDMAEVAPYLVELEPGSEFTNWVIDQGWGNHWGIFAATDNDLRATARHFRAFLIVYDETGRPLRFRYYDPRVLRTYLPTCNAEELAVVFGPVTSFFLEDRDPATALRFQMESGSLGEKKISISRARSGDEMKVDGENDVDNPPRTI